MQGMAFMTPAGLPEVYGCCCLLCFFFPIMPVKKQPALSLQSQVCTFLGRLDIMHPLHLSWQVIEGHSMGNGWYREGHSMGNGWSRGTARVVDGREGHSMGSGW